MTGKDKLKLGLGTAAAIGAGALANQVLMPKALDMKGGWIVKILGVLGVIAVAGAIGDIAEKQTADMVETFSEVPGLIRELKDIKK